MKDLLIVGGASLDRLNFSGQTAQTAGGAGLYTAAAAHQMGAAVTMVAPRPEPMPVELLPLEERIEWIGPTTTPEELPHFVITHSEDRKTIFEVANFGKEVVLDPLSLPEDLSQFRIVHLTPVGSAKHQHEFLKVCRQRGASWISAGTYPCKAQEEKLYTQQVFESADFFFMNKQEAVALFGSVDRAYTSTGKLLFITLGEHGVLVIQGDYRTFVPAVRMDVLDPTGAGDTFCGVTLAGIARGMHPLIAARKANSLAAHMITAVGPTALWGAMPEEIQDPRVILNTEQIARVAGLIGSLPDVKPFNFTGSGFPPEGHPAALDYFFAATLQQFGFWEEARGKYQSPIIAQIDGRMLKGSDYLWRAYLRRLSSDQHAFYLPSSHANMSYEDMLDIFRSDDGSDLMSVFDLRLAQARAYGKDMISLGLSPKNILECANASQEPLHAFFRQLDAIGGYKEDPLRKKAALLAIILCQRPERFLHINVDDSIPPMIDYHLTRSCLRIGLLDVVDTVLKAKLTCREVLFSDEEWAVRYAAYKAIQQLVEQSGKSMGAVDYFFFNARQRCPEMTEPECVRCPVDPVCAHRKELFQPVFRTTFY